jgi:hypothetical protein
MDTPQKNELMFTQLVLMFHSAALQQMGKVKSPFTDKIERDLAAAQNSIDVLDMLREKTRGNLSDDENRLLKQVLQELKLNYVDEVNRDRQKEGEPASGKAGGSEPAPDATA